MMMKNKLIVFFLLSFILTFDFIFVLYKYSGFLVESDSLLGVSLLVVTGIVVILKYLFFLPVIIFQQLGNILGNGDGLFNIPVYWQVITFGIGMGYAYYLSSKFANSETRGTFLWYHILLLSFYLFVVASWLIAVDFVTYWVVFPALYQSYIGFLIYALILVLLFITGKYLNKKGIKKILFILILTIVSMLLLVVFLKPILVPQAPYPVPSL